ncbi:MAG: hypothetical protein ACFCBV_04025 [Phycisphaerales bacterium]
MAARNARRIVTFRMLLVGVAVGVVLALASVPYGTLVREAGFQGWAIGDLPGRQHGVGLTPYSRDLELEGRWMAWGPFIEADFPVMGSPGSIAVQSLPAAVMKRGLQNEEPFDAYWSGFPWRCAVGWWEWDDTHPWLVKWTQIQHRTIVTPLRPIWPGLLGNTLVYAGCVLVPWITLRAIRTSRRHKRGCCLACAYELGQSITVCPECGLESRPTERPS